MNAASQSAWSTPKWARHYKKHWPVYGKDWDEVVKSTQGRPAKYHPSLSPEEIEQMEMGTLNEAASEFPSVFPQQERWFYRVFDHVIGADNGELASAILVRYAYTGDVHGQPMTIDSLRKKGAPV